MTNGKAFFAHYLSLQLLIPHQLLRELIERKASCNFRFLVCFEPFHQHHSRNGWPCSHFLHIIIIEQHHLLIGQMVLQKFNGKKPLMHIKLEDAPRYFWCKYIVIIEVFFNFIGFDHIPFSGIVVLAWNFNSCTIMSFVNVLE